MSKLLLPFLLLALDGPVDNPTAAQVEQAHQLLNGDWEVISYKDDGEVLGAGLFRAKLAKDGRIRVGSRAFRFVNPETNEERVTPFRVNPLKQPKQLDLTTRDDRTVGGIYRFEGDNLIVCLEGSPDSGYPSEFDAPFGSNRTLIRLKMVSSARKFEPSSIPALEVPKALNPPASTPDESAARATFASARKPTESELTRVRELFAGNWDITSIEDDGEKLGSELIRRRFAEDGRIRFGTRAFAIVNPRTDERKVNSYRLDPTKSPSEIDVQTQFDSTLKGIYSFDGDKLTVCLAKDEEIPRPDVFAAPGGSGRLLVRMQLARDDSAKTVSLATPKPKPEPQPAPAPAPTPSTTARDLDAKIRKWIAGSWSMTDGRGTLTTVFQPDGLFVATRTWSRISKRLFGPPSDSSSGSWSYRDGQLTAWVSSTTDPRLAGHQVFARVKTIGEDTMVVTDVYGSVKTLKRLR